jgi:hypothetical protein
VFPYFSSSDVKPMVTAMARRFPTAELVFDALAPFMGRFHNLSSSVLRQSGTRVRWDVNDPAELEVWGLHLLERWCYFSKPEPRLGSANLFGRIPLLANASYILHYQLGT